MIDLGFFNGLTVAVLGLGKSGTAAARALSAAGAEVWAWDDNEDARQRARGAGIPLVELRHANWNQVTTLVLTPGIPHTHPAPHPVVELAFGAGVEVIGDVELLGRAEREARYVGVTGTNGKSTSTSLIGHVLNLAGRNIAVGGNLGTPALELEAGADIYVLEMSSFQLELTLSITFDVAVLLNISPDHLDRYADLDAYAGAKRHIFHRQTRPRTAVVGVDDPKSRAIHDELAAADEQEVIAISGEQPVEGGVYVDKGPLFDATGGTPEVVLDLREIATLPGSHNWQNAAAAYAACRALDIDAPVVAACLRSFPGLRHRQEIVGEIGGVRFVNDSKATNQDAAARALACYDIIYWIAGGRPKERGLASLERFADRMVHAFLIGEAASDFAQALEGRVPVSLEPDLASAVRAAAGMAWRDRHEGAVVLLSPACASFDQFANFEVRGEAFRAAVRELQGPGNQAAGGAA